MNDEELGEVFENDLNFDNYGNVDYTGVLNSDIFVALEAKRLRERALEIGKKFRKNASFSDDTLEKINDMIGDDATEQEEEP